MQRWYDNTTTYLREMEGINENIQRKYLDILFSVLHTLSGMENVIQLFDFFSPYINYLLALQLNVNQGE